MNAILNESSLYPEYAQGIARMYERLQSTDSVIASIPDVVVPGAMPGVTPCLPPMVDKSDSASRMICYGAAAASSTSRYLLHLRNRHCRHASASDDQTAGARCMPAARSFPAGDRRASPSMRCPRRRSGGRPDSECPGPPA